MNEGSAQNRLVGYARVSTTGQTPDGQLAQLKAAGCDPIFKDTAGGAHVDRKELQRMLAKLEPGDAVTVTRIDRLVRLSSICLQLFSASTIAAPCSPLSRSLRPIQAPAPAA